MSVENHPEGSIGRVLHKLTVGTHLAIRKKDDERARGAPRERDLQFQLAITGTASGTPVFADETIDFDYAFFYAPAARESNLEYPHFTYGSQTSPPVGVIATVKEWLRDETNGSIIGAVISVAAIGEGVYKGILHLNFQGYGALIEDQSSAVG